MERDFYAHYFEIEGKHWWFQGRNAIFTEILRSAGLPSAQDTRILDFGCGTGAFLQHLDRFGTVSALDGDRSAVEFCHERGRTEVGYVEPGAPIPFGDETFDLVTAFDVIEHIDDDVGALREFRRVLKPGGALLVAVPAFMLLWGDQDEISQHKRRYRRPGLHDAITRAGMTVERSSYFNTMLFPPIAAIRVLRRRVRGSRSDKTDFAMGPDWINAPLAKAFAAEARWLARGRSFPVGVSAFALARR